MLDSAEAQARLEEWNDRVNTDQAGNRSLFYIEGPIQVMKTRKPSRREPQRFGGDARFQPRPATPTEKRLGDGLARGKRSYDDDY